MCKCECLVAHADVSDMDACMTLLVFGVFVMYVTVCYCDRHFPENGLLTYFVILPYKSSFCFLIQPKHIMYWQNSERWCQILGLWLGLGLWLANPNPMWYTYVQLL